MPTIPEISTSIGDYITGNTASVTAASALKVDGSAVTQPVSVAGTSAGGATANPAYSRIQDGTGTNLGTVLSPGVLQVSNAGRTNANVAAGAAAAALKTGAGRLASVLVTALGTAAITITDGPGGVVIASIAASAVLGTEVKVDRVFLTSLYVNSGLNSPQLTVSYD